MVRTAAPSPARQSRAVLSADPVASNWPSGEKRTARTQSVWPLMTLSAEPSETFQSRAVVSSEPEASVWPSGENAIV
jgi:hypothetical protein